MQGRFKKESVGATGGDSVKDGCQRPLKICMGMGMVSEVERLSRSNGLAIAQRPDNRDW